MCIPFGIFIPPIVISSLHSLEFLVRNTSEIKSVKRNSNYKIQNAAEPSTKHRARLQIMFCRTDFTYLFDLKTLHLESCVEFGNVLSCCLGIYFI